MNDQLAAVDFPVASASAELQSFVNEVLLKALTEQGADERSAWCGRWVEHPEAVQRLAAIYDAYLLVAVGDLAIHALYRDVIDHHLPLLVAHQRGIFERCREGHKTALRLDGSEH